MAKDFSLDDQLDSHVLGKETVVVTCASGGIGSAVCDQLANEGFNLIMVARNQDQLKEQARSLSEKYSGAYSVQHVDFFDLESVQGFCNQLQSYCDRGLHLYGVVMMPPRICATNDPLPDAEVWKEVFANHFINPLELLKGLLGPMRSLEKSKVVIISGISSVQVLSHYALNNAVRSAWLAQAKTLAHALGKDGVRVNTLSLGGVMTDTYKQKMRDKALANGVSFEEQMAVEVSNVPLRKYGSPENVAQAVSSLLGSFSDHLSGENILLDGGFTRSY